jgi:uncharacterized protein involved in response to NO
MPIPRLQPYDDPAILSSGFRPFFLFGAIWAALSILLWLPEFLGEISIPTAFSPVDWHIHEMLFGFVPAIVTGFLFTAVPNWTGRMPLQGKMLGFLVALWLAGRLSVGFSEITGWLPALLLDCAFLAAVIAVIAREIVAGRNYRNLKVLMPAALLATANLVFHLEAHFNGSSDLSRRLGFSAILILIMIIGGRIVPSFTRNWLARENPGRLPIPFNRFDLATMSVAVLALGAWTIAPDGKIAGALLVAAGAGQGLRLARWAGDRAWRDPLVAVLHTSYGFLVLGITVLGCSILLPETVSGTAALHVLAIGAIAGMILAVMVRASRGHTGQALRAGRSGRLSFAAIAVAAGTRVAAEYFPSAAITWYHAAAAAWLVAFLAYALAFAPALARPRGTGKQAKASS